jgi:CHRD domain
MHRSKLLLGLLVLGVAALAVPALSVAGKNTVEVTAKLKGNNEVPGPGDDNGKGEVQVRLKAKKEKVCFNLEIRKLDGASAAHIHKGGPDDAGPVKVLLFEADPPVSGDGAYEGCVENVKKKLVKRIGKNPEKFYVNVHNADYPDGAIRGQLEPTEVVG